MKTGIINFKKTWVFPTDLNNFWYLKSSIVIFATGLWSKGMLEWGNFLEVHGKDILEQKIIECTKGKPLITVSNHESCLDEPCLWGILNWRYLGRSRLIRWTLGAEELLFSNRLSSWFFSHGKVIPVVRGHGVYQKAMDYALEQLNQGGWVHIFPEGKVNLTGKCMRLKWGVGRLIADCKETPTILPFWHVGMDDLLPNRRPYIPQFGKNITVLIDQPMVIEDLLANCKERKYSEEKTRKVITDVIQDKFADLRKRAVALHAQRCRSTSSQ